MRNIARSLPFHGTPQETSRMLLKMEKDVNASLRSLQVVLPPGTFFRAGKILAGKK